MKVLRNYLNRIKPNFEPGGKLQSLQSVFDGFETFLYTPNTTSRAGAVNVHDSLDSKRIMIIVVLALMPCLLFGMYNTGYQNWLAAGATEFPFWELMAYGFLAVLPRILVAYVVGLGIEFAVAHNVFNVALVTRAFLFFAYPAQMSGDKVFVSTGSILGLGHDLPDGFTGATPLGQIASFAGDKLELLNLRGDVISAWDAFIGLIPGSFGETSTLCILIGAALLLFTGIASWRIMLSVIIGGLLMGWIANLFQTPTYPASFLSPVDQLLYGGFAFAAVFMATDPVTAARTGTGKYIYGLLVGIVAVLIRTYNNGYPEGAMLAVLLANALAPLIDYCVVQTNVSRRMRRLKTRA